MAIGLPHFSQTCSVSTTDGTGLPDSSMLNASLHFGYPEQDRNGPRLLSRSISGLPHLGHLCSVSTASARGLPSIGRVALHSGYFEQPRNCPVLLNFTTIGAPQTWQVSFDGTCTRCIRVSASFSSSWNGW